VARDTWYFFATLVSDIPEWRSATTCARSMLSGARPIRLPSSFARRIPARTLSTIRLFSSSAIAPTITTIARPSRVNIFAQANELDVEVAQFVEYFQEMANASRHPIERRNEHDVEAMSPSICQQLIEARAFRFRT